MRVPFDDKVWSGRSDDGEPGDTRRIFNQVVPFGGARRHEDVLRAAPCAESDATVIVGFGSDEGVRRNQGRVGAAQAPKELRRVLAGLPAKTSMTTLADAGDVVCDDGDLEGAQAELANVVSDVLANGGQPLVFGGGHEVAWGTYSGLRLHEDRVDGARAEAMATATRKLLIINFDAHFDLRQKRPANSGTPFDQIANDCAERGVPFNYACFGISDLGNTASLFAHAEELGVRYVLDINMQEPQLPQRLDDLQQLLDSADDVYLTIDLDVLPAATAPAVSAPAALGVPLSVVEAMVQRVRASGKLRAADIAEYNPSLDQDKRTARAAARLAYRLL
ncbi:MULTISPECIES: formimidoylglutamase [Paraburkholderia]|jgi:formiminoglutamase|uniref:Formimidoylglutamase n=1 Tax=Paraburkholderia madseniana TaxID=2599607 RepID=A0AAP5EMM8_9BURK|nr:MULTISPECIES: formimidoylglutamase [Paraburkholderia]MCX4144812.1 formimidoylglutamase [Paraburkholderia madseniana]MCX4174402.1 formimidoylglutamase [Paraburkholderia madseniana]MDN7147764.1 formimidoylglutamase [Paraburkholderia sp. WS6]MDQ6406644.1 formimidoylglutamase [Paraburkholderia madseniana]MDQ6462405.1 formimidoylglutamase [Paraburkholderia madseniana]